METYLDDLDLWEAVEEDYEIPALPNNPTMAQIKAHREENEENKGKSLFVCCSLIHNLYSYHVSKVSKRDMGLSQD